MMRKGFFLAVLIIMLMALNSCVQTAYSGKPLDVDSICNIRSDCSIQNGRYLINVRGIEREFVVTLPENYDKTRSYPLIFVWHGFGHTALDMVGRSYYGMLKASENQAIFIAGQGLPTFVPGMGTRPGWRDKNGRDIAFVRTLINWAKSNLSIDETRIFSMGMSYGGMFSNLLACKLGSQIRAIAVMSGNLGMMVGIQNPDVQCEREHVAAWFAHSPDDQFVFYSKGEAARDFFIETNECSNAFSKTTPGGCVIYNDCAAGYPVVWCSHRKGHKVPDYAGREIWKFFSQF